MPDLIALSGQPAGTVSAPDDVQLIFWAMRLYVRQADGTFRETLPFVAVEPWPEGTLRDPTEPVQHPG